MADQAQQAAQLDSVTDKVEEKEINANPTKSEDVCIGEGGKRRV